MKLKILFFLLLMCTLTYAQKVSVATDTTNIRIGEQFLFKIVIKDTGSISGEVEADKVEVHGHLTGKISARHVVIGSSGVVKGDIEFSQNLRTEDGADIEGYIKKSDNAGKKDQSAGDFLFSKSKDEKKTKKNGKPTTTNNKEQSPLV